MSEPTEVVIEAASLAEARQMLHARIPEGFYALSEEVLSDGAPKTTSATGDTVDGAFLAAEKAVPSGAHIETKKEIAKPVKRVVQVKGLAEADARRSLEPELSQYEKAEAIDLKQAGRRGFLGIGRSPGIYAATVASPAVVEIAYREPAKIRVKMKKRPSKSELLSSLDELERQTSEQWLRLDKPIQGAVVALMVMNAAFQFLREKVSGPFNVILAEAKVLFSEDEQLRGLAPLHLGPPQRSYDVSDIPLVSQQFKEAITRMRQLREIIGG